MTASGELSGKRVCLVCSRSWVSCPSWAIPKTIIKMVQTASQLGMQAIG